ncbi:MAG: hypothetical protein HN855_05610 [Anaerolineae bacterium]|jgi:hypothetical protein|nr:hypothetical protein [Anaerolineae bacterium]MBT7072558.1 hypothetical protein [Anaerolineae bacterium]MBT7324616.1 hypothetical protein [Anaerolineae bacterium]
MPSLAQSLLSYDLEHLRIIAQFWGIEVNAGERGAAREELSGKMLDLELANEVIEALSGEARRALNTMLENQGRISWAIFERQFGVVREVGAGKRDREAIYHNPISAAETLFYRALLARAFFDSENGAQEFAYIPNDLLETIQRRGNQLVAPTKTEYGRLARPEERTHIILANDHLLDDLTTLLASLRLGWDEEPLPLETSPRFVRDLGLAARLINKSGSIQTDSVKSHLEATRPEAFTQLREIWRKSTIISELHQVPNLICEGEWTNPILETRQKLLGFIEGIPRGKWWNLNTFIADIKEKHPDFQRTAGDYDAWFIRRADDDMPLRGFSNWDLVEGDLIRYFITGVLYWLGFVDLAKTKEEGNFSAFRIKKAPEQRLGEEENGKIIATSSGRISVARLAPRVARYQISRFGEWDKSKNPDEYLFQISPASLARASTQGLKPTHLLGLLKKFAAADIPPSLVRALRRWEVSGTEARVKQISVLRLSKPEDLRKLRESKAGRFLGMVLNPTTVEIPAGASKKIMAALIEMGIFMEDEREK